jgi:hypothetical protein
MSDMLAFMLGKLAGCRARQCSLHVVTRPWCSEHPRQHKLFDSTDTPAGCKGPSASEAGVTTYDIC